MNTPKENRLGTIHAAASLFGFALLFGSTDISLFEIVTLLIAVVSIFVLIYEKLYAHISFSAQNRILLGFAILILLQIVFMPNTNTVFALTTLYLLGVYGLTQLWTRKEQRVSDMVIYGYVIGTLASSFMGILAYMNVVMRESLEEIRFFWEDNIRISVFFDDPVVYGAFLVPAVLILSVKALFADSRRKYGVYVLLTLLVFSNLILTGSRGAWLNLLVAGTVFLYLYRSAWTTPVIVRMSGLIGVSMLLACLVIFVIPIDGRSYFAATLENRYQISDQPRIENLRAAPEHISNRSVSAVVFGSGSGTYEKTTQEGFSAHNTYLRVLYEQGVVGLGFFLAFMYLLIKNALAQRAVRPLFTALCISLLLGILVQNMFVDTLHWRHFWLLTGLIV